MQHPSLGADLRSLRKLRGMTLEDLALRLGKSVGWISQVERDISTPRVSDLREMARIYEVPLSLFFGQPVGPENERGRVVRAANRRTVGEQDRGLVEALLSPDLTDTFEVVHSTFQPGSARMDRTTRPTQELAFVMSGQLDIWLDDEAFTIRAGDSFRVRDQSYRWANPYEVPAVAIWVISPPVY